MNLKHIVSLVLVLCICAFFTGCGNDTKTSGSNPSAPATGSQTEDNSDKQPGSSSTDTQPDTDPSGKEVRRIAVDTKPAQSVYVIGDEFSPEGGILSVTYTDGTTAEVPMTDPGVTFSSTTLASEGSKSITVTYGGKTTRINVTVSASGYSVTFDLNYEGAPAAEAVSVAGGATVDEKVPERDGYTFDAWYTDLDYKTAFDFSTPVEEDMTLYAFWKNNASEYVGVTFDYGYYGASLVQYTRPVERNTAVEKPSDPTRAGYAFEGWYTDDSYTTAYDFSGAVSADTTIVAKWNKTVSGIQTYVFEAEDTDLTGKEGVGSSGVSTEQSMIQFDADGNLHPSNSRWVGFLYKNGLSLDFYFASDTSVGDATISISVATELPGTFTFDKSNYSVILNGRELTYDQFTLTLPENSTGEAKSEFETVRLITNAFLQEGENSLIIKVNNNTTIQGTTYQAVGPMVDCVIIETSAVLTWDANHGLPAKNY